LPYRPRQRLLFLGVVNGLILLHILVYYVFDRRGIGCIDFFGLATFAGKGQITAGTVFLAGLILVTLLLGRVFCGWGCHFALFQDLLVRLLNRIGLRTHFRRSRLELAVPPILLFVTLAYPILVWWNRRGPPDSVTVDLAYPEVWHLLPGVKGVLLILLIDVVVLTLLFGSRAFCRYICPYGLFLKCFHVLSPTRIVKNRDCSGCGSCSSACPTGVPIKYEIERFGVIRGAAEGL
jgi:polyferredoxin